MGDFIYGNSLIDTHKWQEVSRISLASVRDSQTVANQSGLEDKNELGWISASLATKTALQSTCLCSGRFPFILVTGGFVFN